MSNLSKLLFTVLTILVIAGCEGTEEDLPGLLNVRLLHASPDGPTMIVTVKGLVGEDFQSLSYKEGTSDIPVRFGNTVVQVESVRPGPEGIQLEFERSDFAPTDETNYEIIFVGKFADSTLDTLVVSNPQTGVSAGSFRMQFVHASPDTADLVVYVTAPDAILNSSPFLGPVGFKNAVAPVENTAGEYQIRVALVSDPFVAIYNSGALTFNAGGDFMMTIINNTGTGVAPISLIVQDGGTTVEFLDDATPADLRFVHTSPDFAPALDWIIDDEMPPAFSGLTFTQFSPYLDLPLVPGEHNIKAIGSPGMVEAINVDSVLDQGVAYTVVAMGLWSDVPLARILLADDIRPVATEAKLRVVNASNITGTFDLYVVAPDTVIGLELGIARLDFQESTAGYISLAAGEYEITITEVGDPEKPIIDPLQITVANGGIYTAVAIDSIGGIAPVQWILMDDFSP